VAYRDRGRAGQHGPPRRSLALLVVMRCWRMQVLQARGGHSAPQPRVRFQFSVLPLALWTWLIEERLRASGMSGACGLRCL
jgi:hypothetical protein